MIETIIIAGSVLGASLVALTKYLDLLDHREERALRKWHEQEQARMQRTADVVAIADQAATVEAALIKHEERISQLELASVGGVARRRP